MRDNKDEIEEIEEERKNSQFKKQLGFDEVALTRKEIMESRGYNA